jgi:GNAT superfamily N-acetyltransferase
MQCIIKKCTEGYIQGIVIDRIAYLQYVFIYRKYRKYGKAIELIKYFLEEAYKIGAVRVELDDCSDNYRSEHNLYTKCGFSYKQLNDFGDNVMYTNIRSSLKKLKIKN